MHTGFKMGGRPQLQVEDYRMLAALAFLAHGQVDLADADKQVAVRQVDNALLVGILLLAHCTEVVGDLQQNC